MIKRELPRLIKLGNIAFKSQLIEYIEAVTYAGYKQTKLVFKIPKPFFNYEEKTITVLLSFEKVVNILNRY
ncbi:MULTISPECIES: hypothetical protein [Streptococcus]|uniref:hypothetical protein n=1 Tax=Streptococcus TaxID=1301 RepID=UPI001CD58CFB|nr:MULTISPECIES: hypothetical protein [Streptococcus]